MATEHRRGATLIVSLTALVASLVLTGLALASAAHAVVPTEGQLIENGEGVTAPCLMADKQIDDEAKSWLLYTYEPKRIHGAGLQLAPSKLPQVETLQLNPNDLSGPSLQGAGIPPESNGSTCQADSVGEDTTSTGEELRLTRAGPYTIEELDSTVHWVVAAPGSPVTAVPCAQNDRFHPTPEPLNAPDSPTTKYEISKYCNIVTLVHFNLTAAPGGCPRSGDGSQFPTDPYLNQYDAGALDKLPSAFGEAGGSACGPSSLLMTLAKVLPADALPNLNAMFDKTMARTAAQAPSGENVFSGANKAVPYLRSIGFKEAKAVPLGEDMISVLAGNQIAIDHALHSGPVVISTAFGTTPWGITGGGHMIVIESRTNTNYVVDDPAGNFFSDPTNHYGAGECGYQVLYPTGWLIAYTTGRWFIELGPYTPPPPKANQRSRPQVAPAASPASDPSAFAVYDAEPGGAQDPTSFYLQDPEGRKAGFVDGSAVNEIPGAEVGQMSAGFTDPAKGDPELDPEPQSQAPLSPRTIVVSSPETGTALHASAGAGSPYALSAEAWIDGSVAASDRLTGTGSGTDALVVSPALETLAPPLGGGPGGSPTGGSTGGSPSGGGTLGSGPGSGAKEAGAASLGGALSARVERTAGRRALLAVSCGGAGKCVGAASLVVQRRHRAVVIESANISLRPGAHAAIKLRLTPAGARLLRSHRHLRGTLVVMQSVASSAGRVVLRGALSI